MKMKKKERRRRKWNWDKINPREATIFKTFIVSK
jgi:hypothetical protein